MISFGEVLSQGTANGWLFLPSALLLGALHGLEPGHSKTMMAAFIVAIRGTVRQAVMLGMAATISHTAVVWGVALGGMYLWRDMQAEESEPYFQLASGVVIIIVALWMLLRTWRDNRNARQQGAVEHPQSHDRNCREIDTGHGRIMVSLHRQGGHTFWQLATLSGHGLKAHEVVLETERPDGQRQRFTFGVGDGCLQSLEGISGPADFMVRVSHAHGNHAHQYDVSFLAEDHGHDHLHEEIHGLEVAGSEYQDAHQLAHANDIRRRFADQHVTTGQIILFGLTGGLIPCPAAITVLLLCLQVQKIALGATLVVCFSIGLALTLIAVGSAAALSVRHASQRFAGFSGFMRKAPFFSGTLILAVGIYISMHGWFQLAARPTG